MDVTLSRAVSLFIKSLSFDICCPISCVSTIGSFSTVLAETPDTVKKLDKIPTEQSTAFTFFPHSIIIALPKY
jgi:hypothetical protein